MIYMISYLKITMISSVISDMKSLTVLHSEAVASQIEGIAWCLGSSAVELAPH